MPVRLPACLRLSALLAASLALPVLTHAQVHSDSPPPARRHSHRLIVELETPSTTVAMGMGSPVARAGRMALNTSTAVQHAERLRVEQQAFVSALQQRLPAAKVAHSLDGEGRARPATYQVLLNAVAIEASRAADLAAVERTLRSMRGVRRVSRDWAYAPSLYASLPLAQVEAAWGRAAIGGPANAGAGIKVASMDGGVHHAAPMFNGSGYRYPAGYPLGDTRNTNGKIIASRAYFRPWDPPVAGEDTPWPGGLGNSHGVHTASTAAGNAVPASYQGAAPVTLSGVAPRAQVMNYRVFYPAASGSESFYTVEGIQALEDIVRDGADVVNNSWGSGPLSTGGEYDALDQALRNAVKAGVFVSMSNGNDGPGLGTTDHASPDYLNVAASTTSGTFAAGQLNVTAPPPVPAALQQLRYGLAQFGPTLPSGGVTGPFRYRIASAVDASNGDGCKAWSAGAFTGLAAVIERGNCDFSLKVLNAQSAGAALAVIYNHVAGGDQVQDMGAGSQGARVAIPSVFLGRSNGLALRDWAAQHPESAQLAVSTIAFQAGNVPDVIASFSSRGPGAGNVLKPDLTAPGVNILAQGYAPEAVGEARHLGYGQSSGTSMAAPHAAGAAALLKQAHPGWSPAWIKSALMGTARYLNIYTDTARTVPAQPLDMGAGVLDVAKAIDPGVILEPPSLSFGPVVRGQSKTIAITVTSVASSTQTFDVRTVFTGAGFNALTPVADMSVSPSRLTLAPGASAQLTVRWSATAPEGDRQGFVVLTSPQYEVHLPAWMRVAYASDLARGQVLLIDNDGSSAGAGTDYTPHYTRTLTALGVRYDLWDADAEQPNEPRIPDANFLAQYKTVIYQTGDNTTPLAPTDLNRLTEYANNGGRIIAFGQDLAAVTQDTAFYNLTLAASQRQDSISAEKVFTDAPQLLTGAPRSFFSGASFDISARGDGAGNQRYVDEVSPTCEAPVQCQGLLLYAPGGNFVDQGMVAVSHRDRPSLERPGTSFQGASLYFAFGLEGVNDASGYNTRAELLEAALHWGWDQATVTIDATPQPAGSLSRFSAQMDALHGGEAVRVRWDFGDGSPYTEATSGSQAAHRYERPGTYRVRVEATNSLGTVALGEAQVTVTAAALRTLRVGKLGGGTGTVQSTPAGINCGGQCQAGFAEGTQVSLTASIGPDTRFAGWRGDCAGEASTTCVVALGADRSVEAVFAYTGNLQDNRDFVEQQYRDFLDREGEPAQVDAWVAQLQQQALTRTQLVAAFFDDAAFQERYAPLERLYFAYFGRYADDPGLRYWAAQRQAGLGQEAISQGFAGSDEFTTRYGQLSNAAFVDQMYLNILGRAPDAGGRAYWLQRLDTGLTRGALVVGFSESVEFRGQRNAEVQASLLYASLLRRTPDFAGFEAAVTQLKAGTPVAGLIGAVLASEEYLGRFANNTIQGIAVGR